MSVCYGYSGSIVNSNQTTVSMPYAVTEGRYLQGTVISYSCIAGYTPIDGNAQVSCSSDGVWQPNRPACASMTSSSLL